MSDELVRARRSQEGTLIDGLTGDDVEDAHLFSSKHKGTLMESDAIGCFSCLSMAIPFVEIFEWVDEGSTAVCPRCGIDAVIGSASGYPVTLAFLKAMHERWFAMPDNDEMNAMPEHPSDDDSL